MADGEGQKRWIDKAAVLAAGFQAGGVTDLRRFAGVVALRVQIHLDRVTLDLAPQLLKRWPEDGAIPPAAATDAELINVVTIPAQLRRSGIEMKMVMSDGSERPDPNQNLIRILLRARAIRDRLHQDGGITLNDIAAEQDVVPSYATRLYRLAFLAPDIVEAIIAGRQPPELTTRRLMDDTRLPLEWDEQRRVLGFR